MLYYWLCISARITYILLVKVLNYFFHWADFFSAHPLPTTLQKRKIMARALGSEHTAARWGLCGPLPARRAVARLCSMQIRLDLWMLRNCRCSSSASPEQLFCIYFYSSFILYSGCCRSPPATRVSGAQQLLPSSHLNPPSRRMLI